MKCFNGNTDAKRRVLQRARQAGLRAAQNEDRKGIFWSRRAWCEAPYVCNKPDCDHSFYANEVGVPVTIAYAEHALFKELDSAAAGKWPERFLNAIPVDLDSDALNEAWRQMALFVLGDSRFGLITTARTPEQMDAITRIIELFEARSTDADAWKEAGRLARQVSHKGPDTSYRLKAEPALLAAGAKACYSAAHFAYAFENQRYAAEALCWAAWAFRYQTYGELVATVREREVPADRNGMVNVGVAMVAFGEWQRGADHCEHSGEVMRKRMYGVYADEFIRIIKRCARANRPGIVPRLMNAGATWRRMLAAMVARRSKVANAA